MKDLKKFITKYIIDNFALKLKQYQQNKPIQFEIDSYKINNPTYFAEISILENKMELMFCDLSYEDTEYILISKFNNLPIYIIHYSLFNNFENWTIISDTQKAEVSNIQIFEYLVGIEKLINLGLQINNGTFNEQFYNLALETIKE